MPLFGRRRPLMRTAMVGGAGYMAGKHMQEGREHETEQDDVADTIPPGTSAAVAVIEHLVELGAEFAHAG